MAEEKKRALFDDDEEDTGKSYLCDNNKSNIAYKPDEQ